MRTLCAKKAANGDELHYVHQDDGGVRILVCKAGTIKIMDEAVVKFAGALKRLADK